MTDRGPMDTKTFSLGHILSITHGRMVVEVGGLYDILNWMTGESLMTHQLPRAARESEGWLLEQFPELAEIDASIPTIKSEADAKAWLGSLAEKYGTDRAVLPLPIEDHTRIDPLDEIAMMRPDLPVVPVILP